MGTIVAVCSSEKKGTQKKNVGSGLLVEESGLEGDAHAGSGHRQVSLLSHEKFEEFARRCPVPLEYGAFGENLLVDGLDPADLPVGARLKAGDVLLEVTQIGKECHSGCAIREAAGDCIMPRLGVFARVLRGGSVRVGDEISAVEG